MDPSRHSPNPALKRRRLDNVPGSLQYEVAESYYPVNNEAASIPTETEEQWNIARESSHETAHVNWGSPVDQLWSQRLAGTVLPVLSTLDPDRDEIVCFGTVPAITGRCEWSESCQDSFPVQIDSSDSFHVQDFPGIRGHILPQHGQMIQGLLDETSLQLHPSCAFRTRPVHQSQNSLCTQLPCTLDITLYGPFELFEEIGSWFQDYDIYLQDPQRCHLDVKYCNPQRLLSDDLKSCSFVSEIVSGTFGSAHLQDVAEQPDLLDIFSSQVELEETPKPALIRASLHRHQKQALTFMIYREKGWISDSKLPHIWEIVDSNQCRFFVNRISHAHQIEAPPDFYGGIIADPMGLGKTLTMIALVAADLANPNTRALGRIDGDTEHHIQATLIIVPQPLLDTWEEQLTEHVSPGALRHRRHHGKLRFTDVNELHNVDIVLTTYHTIAADWKSWKATRISTMFSVCWKRIILDEAHFIRNGRSQMARAICELGSISRWAVTGTPIQNRLEDLTSLLKFIRVYPYNDPKRFDADISRLWKSGEDEEAVKRLKRLSTCLILRRAKGTVGLPSRQDKKCPVDFNRAERAVYDMIRQQTISRVDEALGHDSEISTSGVFVNFLQQIESMRLVCDLGLHYHTRHDKPVKQTVSEWTKVAQQTFNIQREMSPIVCLQCSSILDLTETLHDDVTTLTSPQFSSCLKYICGDCWHKNSQMNHTVTCGHNPRCPFASISMSDIGIDETPKYLLPQPKIPFMDLPSKVKALVSDLKAQPANVKCIVFSAWRLTLDIVEAALHQESFCTVRFDGKVSQAHRQSVLEQFKKDPNTRMMLLTLSCGAVGLTLTEASRAYLMEPHWNPTIEEQALARIHRIGQTQEVTTVRFYIRDSFEERVMEVQESKKHLAGLLLSTHDGGRSDDSLGALQKLRVLL